MYFREKSRPLGRSMNFVSEHSPEIGGRRFWPTPPLDHRDILRHSPDVFPLSLFTAQFGQVMPLLCPGTTLLSKVCGLYFISHIVNGTYATRSVNEIHAVVFTRDCAIALRGIPLGHQTVNRPTIGL